MTLSEIILKLEVLIMLKLSGLVAVYTYIRIYYVVYLDHFKVLSSVNDFLAFFY